MAVNTQNMRVEPMDVTWNTTDLGGLDGDISFSFNVTTVEVTAHQHGTQVLDEIVTGKTVESISMVLKETDAAKVEALIAATGGSFTPASGTEVVGLGTADNFKVLSSIAQKLVLHPTRLEAADLSKDICFWKTVPIVKAFTFSPENVATLEIEFKVFPDFTKETAVNIFAIGDHTQDFDV